MPGCIKQGPSGTKVPRLDRYRSRISLSQVTHQMWCDPPFIKKNKTTKRAAMGMKVGGNVKEGGTLDKIGKRIVGNIGGSS